MANSDRTPVHDTKVDPSAGDLTGTTLGEFKILRLLGRGGMGEVYLAEQTSLKRMVALKILRADLVENQQYRKRFEAEAKAIAPIHHPNIVSVFAIGEDKGFHYIALEYVQGVNLREYLAKKGTLPLPVGLNIIKRVGLALRCAHDAGIIHRDVKPENVLLTKKGEVKVADFGLCRQVTEENVSLTQTGMTMGTPLYMSSEQIRGEQIDHRTDIFSFGVMCYHMFAGETPFRGETAMAVAVQIERGKPIPLIEHRPDLPRALIDLVEKMMAKSPSDRYQSAKDILRDVARLQGKSAEASQTDVPRLDAKSTGDSATTDDAGRATKRALVGPMRTTAALLVTPGRRPWVTAGLLIAALSAGGALGWSERAPNVLEDQRLSSRPVKLPPNGVANVPEKNDRLAPIGLRAPDPGPRAERGRALEGFGCVSR